MEAKVIPGNGIRPARQRLEFGYDGQSRRVVKRVLQKVTETSSWSLRQERRFLYDGWNMIAESSRGTEAGWTDGSAGCPEGVRARAGRPNQLDVPSSGAARVHRAYAWGLDASGTLTGAGGVGGLLLTSHHTPQAGGGTQVTTLAPLHDFNGNVLAYADVATSTITHRMEYDPFGQELSLDTLLPGEGTAEAPRFRFSTKYTDGETGLVYYGYRSYSPELGRWVNRDPIEERGGINLYGMVGNDAVNVVDRLGKDAVHIGSGWYIFIMRSDLSFDSLEGGRITHENENWSCECATGAQWLSGTQKSDGVHDAPSTSTWRKGAPVSLSTAPGTMIATGWVGDRYPSESVSQALQSGRNVVNHVGIFRGFDARGNILLFDQWDPANNGNSIDSEDGVLDTREHPAAHGWFVVKSKFECDARPSGATPRPAQLD